MEELELMVNEIISGNPKSETVDSVTEALISLELQCLSIRGKLLTFYKRTNQTEEYEALKKAVNSGIECVLDSEALWITIPPIIPRRIELGRTVYYEDEIHEKVQELKETKEFKAFYEAVKDKYVMVFEFAQKYPYAKDLDNVECRTVVNVVTSSLLLSDNPEHMIGLFKTSKNDNSNETKVGVMSWDYFAKFVNHEVNYCK